MKRTSKAGRASNKRSKKTSNNGKNGDNDAEKIRVAVVDFPASGSFPILSDDGAAVGSLVTVALDEIIFEIEGIQLSEIEDVTMIYSHPHFDHIGAGTITYNHLVTKWGLGEDEIEVVAVEGVAEAFEKKIALGRFSFRAPLPTSVIVEETAMMLGTTPISLVPASGHTSNEDMMIYFPSMECDDPAIMFFVDESRRQHRTRHKGSPH